MEFPKDFLWGASTSAYQIEGNNKNSDWWEWEMLGKIKYASASACGSYELFTEDFDIAKSLSHNAHRLSVEWGRIEPEEGKFSKEEIGHYRKVILALRERGLEPIVTLHHFTSPIWFTRNYGWSNASCRKYFLRYCAKIVSALAEDVHFWITINEPTIYAYYSYIFGYWPPQEKSVLKAISVINNFAQVHINAYSLIHSIYQEKNLTPPEISIAHHLQAFVPCNLNFRNRLAYYLRNKLHNLYFIERLARKHALDFIGINYYSRNLIDLKRWTIEEICFGVCRENHYFLPKNSLGWEIYPQGLYDLLMQLKRYNLPIMITENGICTDDDTLRWEYIAGHLESIFRAMQNGAVITGYLYWSLLDNFEWDKGFSPRFGLVEVDYDTFKRNIRESARKFSRVCQTGVLKR